MMNAELLNNAQKKDKIAMKQIFSMYFGRMKNICIRYAKDENQSVEFINSSFCKIFSLLNSFILENDFEKWVSHTAIQNCIALLKKNEKEYYVTTTVKTNDAELEKNENNQKIDIDNPDLFTDLKILECIQELPPSYRVLFNLYVIDGYSMEEISKLMEINFETCKRNTERVKTLFEKNIRQKLSNPQ